MTNLIRATIIVILFLILAFICYFFIGWASQPKEITWGVNFSPKYSQQLGLDWRENYTAILEDLQAKRIKISTHWDWIEGKKDEFYFNDLDWKIAEAKKHNAKLILVIGMKTGRWPECHLPEWAKGISKKKQQQRILNLLEKIVLRYKDANNIIAWQVENEPLFPFGECPWKDKQFLKEEVGLVKFLDKERPVIITSSGEFSLWITSSQVGDISGTTLHRKTWFPEIKTYVSYPIPPVYYWRKSKLVKTFFGKEVICVELQAEPWGEELVYNLSLEEQEKTMDLEKFKNNIEYARKTGLDTFYFWGTEWWYWLKEEKDQPQIWNKAKDLFEK